MFDLNNLKTVNDTMGHLAGDQLILNFARLLRNVIPEKDFVGRYGGDEFMAVIYHTSQTEVEEILKCLCLEKDRLNNREDKMLIDYAYGWALSANEVNIQFRHCSIRLTLICTKTKNYVRDID